MNDGGSSGAGRKRWRTPAVDPAAAAALAGALKVPVPLATVLLARGYDSPAAAQRFLNPRLSELSDPFLLPGMAPAVHRLRAALEARQRIVVFGDYDADGVTGAALLTGVLRRLGAAPACFVPNRFEDGYGLTATALARCLATLRPELLVTVDCGTNAAESVRAARAAGVDVIVTDHHAPAGETAPALAVVNPAFGPPGPTRDLAGVGVAFKLCHALIKSGRAEGWLDTSRVDLRDWLDFVAVGTVADVAPLVGENRTLVRHGLACLQASPHIGLRALCEVSGVGEEIQSHHLGFVLGPRLNAAGRVGTAEPAVALLLEEDIDRALALARELETANRERRRIEDEIRRQAERAIDAAFDGDRTFGLVVAREGWHVGTIGIVASRLCGRYGRPVAVIGLDGAGRGRGSVRGTEAVDVVAVLEGCADLLDTFGGHAMAGGLSLRAENVAAFRERFEALCAERLRGTDPRPVQTVDAWLQLAEADWSLYEAQGGLHPTGVGNPAPCWGARGVRLLAPPTRMGKDRGHLRLLLAAGATQAEAVGFGMGEREIPDGLIDIVFRLQQDDYYGRPRLVLHLQDFAPSAPFDS